ncbi:response regulator transcription factor [Rhodospirillaceae bacterium SYSU D60014]|uniref:response regulator transcription factor n=1 Tax=Virgifigura deserti TaxID=2268457 RepID=UPI000E67225C
MMQAPTVFVVDDDDAVREAVGLLLKSNGFTVEAKTSAAEFLAAYDPVRPGCLVLDVRMPGMSGMELQAKLAADQVGIPVIIISGHGDIPMAVAAVQAGAVDFIEKPFDEHRLLATVQRALALDEERRRESAAATGAAARQSRLTAREREVLERVVAGDPNKVIAARLGISARTVEIHRARVMEKMRARSVAELVQMTLNAKPDKSPLN